MIRRIGHGIAAVNWVLLFLLACSGAFWFVVIQGIKRLIGGTL